MNRNKWNQLMNEWQEKLRRFMIGRYGMDELGHFMMILLFGMILLGLVIHSALWYWMELACIVITYFRMFSRNTGRRFQENQAFLNLRFHIAEKIRKWDLKNWKEKLEEFRKYKIFRCPNCGQKIRIPRGHGKIRIHCRTCGKDFIGKS